MWREEKGGLSVKRQLLPRKGRNRLHSALLYFTLLTIQRTVIGWNTMHKYKLSTNTGRNPVALEVRNRLYYTWRPFPQTTVASVCSLLGLWLFMISFVIGSKIYLCTNYVKKVGFAEIQVKIRLEKYSWVVLRQLAASGLAAPPTTLDTRLQTMDLWSPWDAISLLQAWKTGDSGLTLTNRVCQSPEGKQQEPI